MPKIPKKNNPAPQKAADPVLTRMRKRIAVQAALAMTAVALTVIMLFAMTAAWYTNIVHTSGLVFEVETWGFNGDITSSNTLPIVASPGDDGLIDLQVVSGSDSPSAVSVTFSKAQMPAEMQQRIFFYVDDQAVRNDEVVERVYLNSQDSYTYNLFSQGSLTLTETVHNAPQIKWHWVYDVLGYYVQGNLLELSNGQNTKVLVIEEYLRPIEYDYDKATMGYVTDSKGVTTMTLKTVDGERSPEEFLVEFSRTDGYKGEIDPKQKKQTEEDGSRIFYPVDVDEDGTGVYAYLCSYAEIQQSTAEDTAMGQGEYTEAMPTSYKAKLMVSAQKSKNTVVGVNSLSGLTTALDLGAAASIQLSGDVNIGTGQVLTIKDGQRVMLDLNQHSLTSSDPGTIPIVVEEGGSLTMVNGTIAFDDSNGASKTYAIEAIGAEVVMSNVDLSGYELGMKISDSAAAGSQDSTVRLVNCKWTTNDTTLLVYGNGRDTVQKTQVIIEDSELVSNNITLCGNGSMGSATDGGNYGTDIQIINSVIESTTGVFSAIYQPQRDSVLTIYNSTISGYTGVAIKGGTVNIIGSTVEGWGEGMETVDEFANSGFNDTGDAVYIETNYNYPIELNISDLATGATPAETILTSAHNYALRVYDPKADWVKVNIVSGTFTTKDDGNRAVPSDALFRGYVASGSEWAATENGKSYFVTLETIGEQSGAEG